MDCERFEAEVQETLDRRDELCLSDSAEAHRLICEVCDNSWQMYSGLQKGFHFGPTVQTTQALNIADRFFQNYESAQLEESNWSDQDQIELQDHALASSIPVAQISIPKSESKGIWNRSFWNAKKIVVSAASVAALVIVAVTVNHLVPPTDPGTKGTTANGNSATVKNSVASGKRQLPGVAKNGSVPNNQIAVLSNQFSESFIEIDKQWQSYGSARVTMESVPGIREGTFPITGTFDILRHNLSAAGN